jgi:hypothetical protein
MSGFLNTLRKGSEFVHQSNVAYDTDGAADGEGYVASLITGMENTARTASAVNPKQIPAVYDAIKNLNGAGLDDRKFLVSAYFFIFLSFPRADIYHSSSSSSMWLESCPRCRRARLQERSWNSSSSILVCIVPDRGVGPTLRLLVLVFKDLPHPPNAFLGPVDMSPSKAPVPEKPSYASVTCI